MRALVLARFGALTLAEVDEPLPRPDEVVIDVLATGICGSDVHGFAGRSGRRTIGQVMGHETVGLLDGAPVSVNPVLSCGRCAACTAGTTQRCPQRVMFGSDARTQGAFAERIAVPLAAVVPLPALADPDLGALIEPLAVGVHAVARAALGHRTRLHVVGGGPIGQACVRAAVRAGLSVSVSEPAPDRAALCRLLGATTATHTPDAVIDAVGSASSLRHALGRCPDGGRVVLLGLADPHPSIDAFALSVGEREVIGSYCYTAAEFAATAASLVDDEDVLSRLVQARVGMDEAPAWFEGLSSGARTASKVLVRPT